MATYTFNKHQFSGRVMVRVLADGAVAEVESYCAQDNPAVELPRESVFVNGYGWLGITDVITPKHAVVVAGSLPNAAEVARRIAVKEGRA